MTVFYFFQTRTNFETTREQAENLMFRMLGGDGNVSI